MQRRIRHFKPQRYKAHRKPIDKVWIIAIVSAAVILAASIALGNYLGKISEPDTSVDTESSTQSPPKNPYDAYQKLPASVLAAYPMPSEAYESDEQAERAILRANGELIRGLCINLLDESGAPSYNSELYRRVYSAESGGFDLESFIQSAKKSSIALTSVFEMNSYKEENADIKAERVSFELSLISEAYSLGVREVLLTGLSATEPDELYSFMKKLKADCPELSVGILLPSSYAAETILCEELDDIFDFLAFDHTKAFINTVSDDTDGDADSDTDEVKSELYLSIESLLVLSERFSAKVYIDLGDGCESCLETAKTTLASLGVENYILTLSEGEER